MKNYKVLKCIMLAYLVMFGINEIVFAAGMNCSSLGDLKTDMQNVFNFIKIVVPLLVIGLSSFDFIKAITGKNDRDIKKAFNRLLKRFLYAILLFFLPVILELLLDVIISDSDVCID